jgi:microcystin-dependent protein
VSQPFVGEIRMFGGNFAPVDWFFCNGQLLAISQFETLFNLIGTTYGGDGQTTFALPDLRSRIPIHQGSSYVIGQLGGVEEVTLTVSQLPGHSHGLPASSSSGTSSAPAANVPASWSSDQYAPSGATVMMGAAVGNTGGSQPHNNVAPFLVVNFIISAFGIFPSQN